MDTFKLIRSKIGKPKYNAKVPRFEAARNNEYSTGITRIINLLNYTKDNSVSYSGGKFSSGYHSFEIDGYQLSGQRNPKMRLDNIPFSFDGLSVLDVGCNQGGMLFELSQRNRLKFGVGIDYDSRMVNVANKIKSHSELHHLDYYVFDLEKENLNYIKDFLPEEKVDVTLLLSVCMWLKNWEQVIGFIAIISRKLIFESNGSDFQQLQQEECLKKIFRTVQLISERSDDDPSQKNRKLFYCTNDEA